MSFITGLLLIDAPASALNNLGNDQSSRDDNKVRVKTIRTPEGEYPYVSAQAFRYWLRETLDKNALWKAAPIFREKKIAYTDANPIIYWDDDLFGYMRAPSTKTDAVKAREEDESRQNETQTTDTITRVSPFRVSTLVSIAPVILGQIVNDFGVMARHEGNPVPHEHQFYRATLRGLFSLDLCEVGTFSYKQKTGYRNLDTTRQEQAEAAGLTHNEVSKTYRLSEDERLQRVITLLDGLAQLEGGAKQTIHYTDVAPPLVILAVTKGGNHIFGHVVGVDSKRLPVIKTEALVEALDVYSDEILSKVYIGWTQGYLDDERAKFEDWAKQQERIKISHPRQAYQELAKELEKNPSWLA